MAGSTRCGGNGFPKWTGWASSSSHTSKGSPPTATIPFGSASSSRSTPTSKRSCAEREACETKRCWYSNSNGRPRARFDRHVTSCDFFIQRQCIHFGEDRPYRDLTRGDVRELD